MKLLSNMRLWLLLLVACLTGCASTVRSHQQSCEQRFVAFMEMCDCLRRAVYADSRIMGSSDYRVTTYLQAADELSAAVEAKAVDERTAKSKLSDIYVRLARGETITPTNSSAATSGNAVSTAPCVTGYCGPVNVRGYYRKDGTYVQPHTRSRRK